MPHVPSVGSVVAGNVPRAVAARGGAPMIKHTNRAIYLKGMKSPGQLTFFFLQKVNSL